MFIPIGSKMRVRSNRGGYPPHFVKGKEYEIAWSDDNKFRVVQGDISCPPGCPCQGENSSWFFDDNFELVLRRPIRKGDTLAVLLDSCFEVGEIVTVEEGETPERYAQTTCRNGRHAITPEPGYYATIDSRFAPITPEDVAKAVTLPSVEDVMAFMRRKSC